MFVTDSQWEEDHPHSTRRSFVFGVCPASGGGGAGEGTRHDDGRRPFFRMKPLLGFDSVFFYSSPRSPIVDDFLVLLFLFSLGFLSFGKQHHHLLTWSVLNIFGNIENRQQGPKSSHDDEEQKRRRRNEMMMNPITAEHSRGGGLCAPVLYSNGVWLPNWNSACTGDAVALTHIRWWSLITEITKVSAA